MTAGSCSILVVTQPAWAVVSKMCWLSLPFGSELKSVKSSENPSKESCHSLLHSILAHQIFQATTTLHLLWKDHLTAAASEISLISFRGLWNMKSMYPIQAGFSTDRHAYWRNKMTVLILLKVIRNLDLYSFCSQNVIWSSEHIWPCTPYVYMTTHI